MRKLHHYAELEVIGHDAVSTLHKCIAMWHTRKNLIA